MSNNAVQVWLCRLEAPEQGTPAVVGQWLPQRFNKEMLQYRQLEDQARYAVGRYLLHEALCALGRPNLLETLTRDSFGRYCLPGMPDFNISHSGHWVGLAWRQEGRIGLDIEKKRPIDPSAFVKQFSPTEMQAMLSSPNPEEAFFRNWTRKESVMKAEGRGMRIPLHSIRLGRHGAKIEGDSRFWYYKGLDVDVDHSGHVCSDTPLGEVEVRKLNLA